MTSPTASYVVGLADFSSESAGLWIAVTVAPSSCLDASPAGLPINHILRYRMYFTDYGWEKEGMRQYAAVARNATVCASCVDRHDRITRGDRTLPVGHTLRCLADGSVFAPSQEAITPRGAGRSLALLTPLASTPVAVLVLTRNAFEVS